MLLNIKSQLPPGVKLMANWMGWFKGTDGRVHAANVCQSDDPRTIRNQCLAAHAVGLDGFVVDWYGGGLLDKAMPTDAATLLLGPELAKLGMEFSLMLDKGLFRGSPNKQQALATGLQYARQKYFTQPNYTHLNGKPVIWEFDWALNGINMAAMMKANPDLCLLSKNHLESGASGSYAWVTVTDPAKYMAWYAQQNDPIMVPCLFDGFDDHSPTDPTRSRWGGAARGIPYGQWQMCLDAINKAAAAGKKYPMVQICTWNDYDERTEIESQALALAGLKLF